MQRIVEVKDCEMCWGEVKIINGVIQNGDSHEDVILCDKCLDRLEAQAMDGDDKGDDE